MRLDRMILFEEVFGEKKRFQMRLLPVTQIYIYIYITKNEENFRRIFHLNKFKRFTIIDLKSSTQMQPVQINQLG